MDASRELIVFSDDWGRHPSSCQHLVRELLEDYRVHWFNTIGTRRPSLDAYAVRRGFEKLVEWSLRRKERTEGSGSSSNPTVHRPVMWPSFRSRLGRRLNARLLRRAVANLDAPAGHRVGVTTLPIAADLVGSTPVERWVYYCVDDLSEWPGLDREGLQSMERVLVDRVDAIVAVSENLVERMAVFGRKAELLTHGIDADHWAPRSPSRLPLPDHWRHWPKPWVVFWGVVDQRLAFPWVEGLAKSLSGGTILMIGPANEPDSRLHDVEHVVQPGAVEYDLLPSVAAETAVLIMPYADLPATRAMQPLKLKEYLATGKPVVAADLPATREWADACDLVETPEAFSTVVHKRLEDGLPLQQKEARERLVQESWAGKAQRFEATLRGSR